MNNWYLLQQLAELHQRELLDEARQARLVREAQGDEAQPSSRRLTATLLVVLLTFIAWLGS